MLSYVVVISNWWKPIAFAFLISVHVFDMSAVVSTLSCKLSTTSDHSEWVVATVDCSARTTAFGCWQMLQWTLYIGWCTTYMASANFGSVTDPLLKLADKVEHYASLGRPPFAFLIIRNWKNDELYVHCLLKTSKARATNNNACALQEPMW